MKKLLYTTCFILLLTFSACNSINSGVKVISKCCKGLSGNKGDTGTDDGKNRAIEYSKGASLLPFNSWDTKMMIW